MQEYIVAFNIGNISSRAIVFDKNGSILPVAQKNSHKYFHRRIGQNMIQMK